MRSSSSPDALRARPPQVAGFEITGVLGSGPRGTVYVATQEGLGRRVALKLYAPPGEGGARPDFSGWPEHPRVARLHAAGRTVDGGYYTAVQLAAGSLAKRLAAGDITREDALALCDEAAAALAALGVAHGALGPGNVLLDAHGRVLLCDFGMAGVDASSADDERALAELRALCARQPPRRRRGRLFLALPLAGAVALAIFSLASPDPPSAPPAPLPGSIVLGSALSGGTVGAVGCDGQPPNGSAPPCTIVPLGRDGRPLKFATDGVIRRWGVRGASGVMFLRVLRPAGHGRYVERARAQPERVSEPTPQVFPTDLGVRRGDLAAIGLRPGAGVGRVRPAGGEGARALGGTAPFLAPRSIEDTGAGALNGRIEVRVEYLPGRRPSPVPTLAGAEARRAPAGRLIKREVYEFPGLRARTFAVVALRDSVALDLFRGRTRISRIAVVGADPRGRLALFETLPGGTFGPLLKWINPDGREILHRYDADTEAITAID